MKTSSLFNLITSDQNIYNAIYSMESYVFEKGLLSEDDMSVYIRLTDKYDFEYIATIIDKCRARLNFILSSDKLFDVSVYFKLKKYDEESNHFVYRPIHTASLIDQICMICMLQPLMFDDDAQKRTLSEISKLLPHNFFGNIPSCNVDDIFVKWQLKYKEYSDTIIHKCHEYKDTKQYSQEVCLDMVDFFPSINPAYVFNFIREKMQLIFSTCLTELETVLVKLLYFHIKKENLKGWDKSYYRCDIDESKDFRLNQGIAQGLPQSYYFGNLYMIKVAEFVNMQFPGDAYYYVDDSVVFTNNADANTLQSQIEQLNKLLADEEANTVKSQEGCLSRLAEEYSLFQKQLKYGTKFHSSGKSYITPIDDSYDGRGGLQYLTRQVSMAAFLGNNMDEIEDNLSKDKIQTLIDVIDTELEKLNTYDSYRVKLLKRHKKYFLYRLKQLSIREEGEVSKDYLSAFYKLFQIRVNAGKRNLKLLSDTFDEEIFQTECRLIVNLVEPTLYESFEYNIVNFESELNKIPNNLYLYYVHDIRGAKQYSEREYRRYSTLEVYFRKRYSLYRTSDSAKRQEAIDSFIAKIPAQKKDKTFKEYFVTDKTRFVFHNSEEFTRRIYNAFYSTIYGFEVNDRHNFCKTNNRGITYTELRIMSYLRNRYFKKDLFEYFAYEVCHNEDELLGKMHIDMAILEVLHLVIANVKDPEYVDDIILTHRLVSGLWKNGSKFLNAYTLHNEDHAIKLIQQCLRILKVVDYLGIKHNDYYVLFLACYLHDISMVIHPDMNEFKLRTIDSDKIVTKNLLKAHKLKKGASLHENVREYLLQVYEDIYGYFEAKKRMNHPCDSAVYIRKHSNDFLKFVNDAVLDIVALVSESHGFDSSEVYGRKSGAKSQLYSIKYMMILIRMADLMDMCNDRVNYFRLRENLSSLSTISKFHWTSHLITDNAFITARYKADPKKRLYEHPITETIQIRIALNVDYSATIPRREPCRGCEASYNVLFNTVGMSEKEIEGKHCIRLTITDNDNACSQQAAGKCPIICAWMSEKNKYLINELVELKRYLNKTNTRLFTTEFEILLIFSDSHKLDSDMFDSVHQYLLNTLA